MDKMRQQFATVAGQLVDIEQDGAAWTVFEDYKRVERDGEWWIEARGKGRAYRPLFDKPAMFADLARVGERCESHDYMYGAKREARAWALKYGVLGLSPVPKPTRKPGGGLVLRASGDPGDLLESFGQGDHRRDSVAAFVREAWTAAQARKFYRAAQDRDLDAVERLDEFDEFRPNDIPRKASDAGEAYVWGMNAAAEIAQGRVAAWCAPAIYRRDGRMLPGWGFENLAGAAWLQFLWELTADKSTQRCENPDCPNLNPPIIREPGKTGPRQEYCDAKCRKHAHYVNETKPRRRQARRAKAST